VVLAIEHEERPLGDAARVVERAERLLADALPRVRLDVDPLEVFFVAKYAPKESLIPRFTSLLRNRLRSAPSSSFAGGLQLAAPTTRTNPLDTFPPLSEVLTGLVSSHTPARSAVGGHATRLRSGPCSIV
jgi:hypothetical protein